MIGTLRAYDDQQSLGYSLAGMAAAAAGQSQLERAAILAGAAQQLLDATWRSHQPPAVKKLWQFIDQSLSTLGAEQIQILKTHREAMKFDQLIRFAVNLFVIH